MQGGGRGVGAWGNHITKPIGAVTAWGLQERGEGTSDLFVSCATTLEGGGGELGDLERLSLRAGVPKHRDERMGTMGPPEMISDSPLCQNLPAPGAPRMHGDRAAHTWARAYLDTGVHVGTCHRKDTR